jgi:hypothetical protein
MDMRDSYYKQYATSLKVNNQFVTAKYGVLFEVRTEFLSDT